MAKATLTISSKNYGAWSLRGWLLCRMAGLDFAERYRQLPCIGVLKPEVFNL